MNPFIPIPVVCRSTNLAVLWHLDKTPYSTHTDLKHQKHKYYNCIDLLWPLCCRITAVLAERLNLQEHTWYRKHHSHSKVWQRLTAVLPNCTTLYQRHDSRHCGGLAALRVYCAAHVWKHWSCFFFSERVSRNYHQHSAVTSSASHVEDCKLQEHPCFARQYKSTRWRTR